MLLKSNNANVLERDTYHRLLITRPAYSLSLAGGEDANMVLGNDIEERYGLITRRIPQEYVFGESILREALSSKARNARVLWGELTAQERRLGLPMSLLSPSNITNREA